MLLLIAGLLLLILIVLLGGGEAIMTILGVIFWVAACGASLFVIYLMFGPCAHGACL